MHFLILGFCANFWNVNAGVKFFFKFRKSVNFKDSGNQIVVFLLSSPVFLGKDGLFLNFWNQVHGQNLIIGACDDHCRNWHEGNKNLLGYIAVSLK